MTDETKDSSAPPEERDESRRDFLKVATATAAGVIAGAAVPGVAEAQFAPGGSTPASGGALQYIRSRNTADLKQVRLNSTKPFEQMTIGELSQLRPGGAQADSYSIEALERNVTVRTSSIIAHLADMQADIAVQTAEQLRPQLAGKSIQAKVPIDRQLNLRLTPGQR